MVYTEDAFAIKTGLTLNTRWQFNTAAGKVEAFKEWLQQRIDAGVLEVPRGQDAWTATHVESAYKKAVVRSYVDAKGAELAKSSDFYNGSKAQFLESAFASPTAISQIELLATRTYEALKGVTTQMSTKMARVASDAMAHGWSPAKMAKGLREQVGMARKRAMTVARTELANAYSEGQLDAFDSMNVQNVGVFAEWSTAQDDRVCPQCQPLEGVVMTIQEARGILPRHPNCRCAYIPALDEPRNKREEKQRAAAVKRQAARSARLEVSKRRAKTKAEAIEKSTWAGADLAK